MTENNKSNKPNPFDKSIDSFLNNIESLRSTFPLIIGILRIQRDKTAKEHNEFLEKDCEYDAEQEVYWIKPENSRKNAKLKKAATNSELAEKTLTRNFIVSLVSQFDTFIGDLMRCVFDIKPHIIDASERKLTYSDLKAFNSIENAQEYIVEKEIEAVLRDSHSEQFSWFERKLNLKLRSDLPAWKGFVELTQRRNLFVHNDGKVSTQYMSVCKDHGVELPKKLKAGDSLPVNKEYFDKAFDCLFEISLKLNQVLRRSLEPDKLGLADDSFMNITFDLIQNKQYKLAEIMFEFEDKYIKKYSNQDTELRILLNRAQTYKWLGKKEKCEEIIKSRDWSACGEIFKMTSNVLIEEYKLASESMKLIGDNENVIHKSSYIDWPIFKEFIQTTEFKLTYKEIYKDEVEVKETTTTQQTLKMNS
jgi:hypothetical protein